MVIDELRDENNALKNCSLVCKNWLPRSSKHLFTKVQGLTWPRFWDFLDDLRNNKASRIQQFALTIFFDLEDSEDPGLCDLDELTFGVHRILRLLPALQTVNIKGDGKPHITGLLPNRLPLFPSVKLLKLTQARLTSFIIQSYTHIDTLELELQDHTTEDLDDKKLIDSWPTITNIRLTDPVWSCLPLLTSLFKASPPKTLFVHFNWIIPTRLIAVEALLGLCKTSLVEFTILCPPVPSLGMFHCSSLFACTDLLATSEPPVLPNLALCKNVQHVTIHLGPDLGLIENPDAWATMLSLLAHLPRNTRFLTVRFDMIHGSQDESPYDVVAALDWQSFCGAIGPISASLQRLVISLPLLEPFYKGPLFRMHCRTKAMDDKIKKQLSTWLRDVRIVQILQAKSKTGYGIPVMPPSFAPQT